MSDCERVGGNFDYGHKKLAVSQCTLTTVGLQQTHEAFITKRCGLRITRDAFFWTIGSGLGFNKAVFMAMKSSGIPLVSGKTGQSCFTLLGNDI